ncbi:aminoacyl-histidine dipeptidase [Thalassotalea litorea]|uniref:Cytosol non-specific dipeptidase n=1 Tax=Thalassotalea litorea TaxID=2020715 RepID=A0A5R9IKT7_9GAMM|nr:aminoacyl-histidine dipeptidase [Thalassotalea litorea]TLU64687.1 aminoacyl-histidine dipeptidase [Thalassotalea litorea]
MKTLAQLSPQPLWQIFANICEIPHPSKHEQKISAWILQWAKDKGLSVKEDAVGNLFIKKPATAGMEDRPGVILQAHMDMVPQKNADNDHNFLTDPILAYVDGDWVTAKGTTLGADNGVGLASAMAVLASDDVVHGPLEVLVTIDEEAGMSGAFGLEAGWLDGDILINTDSEQDGEIYMGCAGGVDASATFPLVMESVPSGYQSFNLSISGLKGGHSGVDIHTGRANANKLLVRLLNQAIAKFDIQLTELNGGSLRNAIPREANTSFVIPTAQVDSFKTFVEEHQQQIKTNLAIVEPDVSLLLISPEIFAQMWTKDCQRTILNALNVSPNGVLRMSDDVPGVVETSVNLGVVRMKGNKLMALSLIRSLHDDGRTQVEEILSSVYALAGVDVTFSGAYPGWKPSTDSQIMNTVRDVFVERFDYEPKIMVIHAGLECGLFKTEYPNLDMVSIGPTIKFPHSPDEKVDIASVGRYWQLLVAVLAAIPAKTR